MIKTNERMESSSRLGFVWIKKLRGREKIGHREQSPNWENSNNCNQSKRSSLEKAVIDDKTTRKTFNSSIPTRLVHSKIGMF